MSAIVALYNTVIYNPLYNGLILMMDLLPWFDVGLIIILFTVLVKLILFPLSKKSVATQLAMRKYEAELKELRETHKEDKQKLAQETMAFYKDKGIRPFLSFFLILIQLPIIFALYRIFYLGGLPVVDVDILYSFVEPAKNINMMFLGLIDVSGRSIALAVVAGITTHLQIRFSMPKPKPKDTNNPSFKDDLAHSMHIQMKYVFPIFAAAISWYISAAIALYWITSNLFTIGQELVVRKKFFKDNGEEEEEK